MPLMDYPAEYFDRFCKALEWRRRSVEEARKADLLGQLGDTKGKSPWPAWYKLVRVPGELFPEPPPGDRPGKKRPSTEGISVHSSASKVDSEEEEEGGSAIFMSH